MDNLERSRQQEILKAAMEVFLEKGYKGAKMADISKRANLSKGLTYFYYENKAELFFEVMNISIKEYDKFIASFKEIILSKSENEMVLNLIESIMTFTQENKNVSESLLNLISLSNTGTGVEGENAFLDNKNHKLLSSTMLKMISSLRQIIDEGVGLEIPNKGRISPNEVFWLGVSTIIGQYVVTKALRRVEEIDYLQNDLDFFMDANKLPELLIELLRGLMSKN